VSKWRNTDSRWTSETLIDTNTSLKDMSKKHVKAQASSARAFSSAGALGTAFGSTSGFGSASSALSYLAEQPDLTAVSDPNVVVSFKNLSKKDSTTKSKALEDIQSYVGSLIEQKQEPEEAFLEAWVGESPLR